MDATVAQTGVSLDKAYELLDEAMVEMYPTEEEWGATPRAIANAEQAQNLFAPKRKRPA